MIDEEGEKTLHHQMIDRSYVTQAQSEASAFLSINLLDDSEVTESSNHGLVIADPPVIKSDNVYANVIALGKIFNQALDTAEMGEDVSDEIQMALASASRKLGESIVRKHRSVLTTLPDFDSSATKLARFLRAVKHSTTSSFSSSSLHSSLLSSSSSLSSSSVLRHSGFASTPVLQNPRDNLSPFSSRRSNDRQSEASGLLATLSTLRRTLRASGLASNAVNVREELFNLVYGLYYTDHLSEVGQNKCGNSNLSSRRMTVQKMDGDFNERDNSSSSSSPPPQTSPQRREKGFKNRQSDHQSPHRNSTRHSMNDIENFLIAVASDAIADKCEPTALAVRDALLLCCSLLAEEVLMKGRSLNQEERPSQSSTSSERLLTMLWRIVQLQSKFARLNNEEEENLADDMTVKILKRVRCISRCSAVVHQRERIDGVSCEPNLLSGATHPVFEHKPLEFSTSTENLPSPVSLESFNGSSLWVKNEASWNVSRIINRKLSKDMLQAPFSAFPEAPSQSAWIDIERVSSSPHSISPSLKQPLMSFISHQEPWVLVFASNEAVHCVDLGLYSSTSGPRQIASCSLQELFALAGPCSDCEDSSDYSISGISDCLNGTFLVVVALAVSSSSEGKGKQQARTRVLVVSNALTSAKWASDMMIDSSPSAASGLTFDRYVEGDATMTAKVLVGLLLNDRKMDQLLLEHYLYLFSTRSQTLIVANSQKRLSMSQNKEAKLADDDDDDDKEEKEEEEEGQALPLLGEFLGCSSILRSSDDLTHVLIIVSKRCAYELRKHFGSLLIPSNEVAILVTFDEKRRFVRAVSIQFPFFDSYLHGLSGLAWIDANCIHVVRVSRDEEAFDDEGREEKARIESYCIVTGTLVSSGKDLQSKRVALEQHSVSFSQGLQATVSLHLVSSSASSERFLIRYAPHVVNRAIEFGLREFHVSAVEPDHVTIEDDLKTPIRSSHRNGGFHLSAGAPAVIQESFKNSSAFENDDAIFQDRNVSNEASLRYSPHQQVSVSKAISLVAAIASDFFNSSLWDPSPRILLQVAAIAELAAQDASHRTTLSSRDFLNLLHSVLSGISYRVLCVYTNSEIDDIGSALSSLRLSIDGGVPLPLIRAIYSLFQKQSTDKIAGSFAKWALSTHCLLFYSNENEKNATEEALIFSALSASVGMVGGAFVGTELAARSVVAVSTEIYPGLCIALLTRSLSLTAASSSSSSSILVFTLDLFVRFTLAFGLNPNDKQIADRVHAALKVVESLVSLNEQTLQISDQASRTLKSLQKLCLSLLPRFFNRQRQDWLSPYSLDICETVCTVARAVATIATQSYVTAFAPTNRASDTGDSPKRDAQRNILSRQVLKLPLPVTRVSIENTTAPPFSSVEKSRDVFALCERHHRRVEEMKGSTGPDCEPVGWATATLVDFSSGSASCITRTDVEVVVPSIVLCSPGQVADAVLYIGVPSLVGSRLAEGSSLSPEDDEEARADSGREDVVVQPKEVRDVSVVFETCIRPRDARVNNVLGDPRLQALRSMLQERDSAPHSRARRLALNHSDLSSHRRTAAADSKTRDLLPRSVRARGGMGDELFDKNFPVTAISVRYSKIGGKKASASDVAEQGDDLLLSISSATSALFVLVSPLPTSSAVIDPQPRWETQTANDVVDNVRQGSMSREMANDFLKAAFNVVTDTEGGRVDAANDERLLSGTGGIGAVETESSIDTPSTTKITSTASQRFIISAPFLLSANTPQTLMELSVCSSLSNHGAEIIQAKKSPTIDAEVCARQGYTSCISACEFLVRLLSTSSLKQASSIGDQPDNSTSSVAQVELDRWLASPLFSSERSGGKKISDASRLYVGTILQAVSIARDEEATCLAPLSWMWMLQQQARLSSHKLLREMAWGNEAVNVAERCVAIAIIWHAGEDVLADTFEAFKRLGGLSAPTQVSSNKHVLVRSDDLVTAAAAGAAAERGKKYLLDALTQARRIRRWMFDERKLVINSPSSSEDSLPVASSPVLESNSFYANLAVKVKLLACGSIDSPVSGNCSGIESSSRHLIPLVCSRALNVEIVQKEAKRVRTLQSIKECANSSARMLISCLLRSATMAASLPGSVPLCIGLDNENTALDRLLRIVSSSALPFAEEEEDTVVSEASSALSCVDAILFHLKRGDKSPSLLMFASDILRCLMALSPSLSSHSFLSSDGEKHNRTAFDDEAKEVANRLGGLSLILADDTLALRHNRVTKESPNPPSISDISSECKATSRRNNIDAQSLLSPAASFSEGWEAPVFQREAAAALREAVSRGGPRVGLDVSRAPFLDVILPQAHRLDFHSLFARVPVLDPSRSKDYSNVPSDFLISISPVETDDDASSSAWSFGDARAAEGVNSNLQSLYEPIYSTIDQSTPWQGVAGWTPVPAASIAVLGGGAWSTVRRVRAQEASPPNSNGTEGGWRCLLTRADLDRWWGLSGHPQTSSSSSSSTTAVEGRDISHLQFPITRIRISILSAESNASRARLLGLSVFAYNADQLLQPKLPLESSNVSLSTTPSALAVNIARVFESSLVNSSSSSSSSHVLRSTAQALLQGMVVNKRISSWTRKTALALLMKSSCEDSVAKCVQHLMKTITTEKSSISCPISLLPSAASLALIAYSNRSNDQSNRSSVSALMTEGLLKLVEKLHPLIEDESNVSLAISDAASRGLAIAARVSYDKNHRADMDSTDNFNDGEGIFSNLLSLLERSIDSLNIRGATSPQTLACRSIWAILHVLSSIFSTRCDSKSSASLQEGMLAFLEGHSPQSTASLFSGSVFSQSGPSLLTLVVIQSLLQNNAALVQQIERKGTHRLNNASLGPSFSVSRSRLVPLQVGIARQHSTLGMASFGHSVSTRLSEILSILAQASHSMTVDVNVDPLIIAHGHALLTSTMRLISIVSVNLPPTSLTSLVNSLPESIVSAIITSACSFPVDDTVRTQKMIRSALKSVSMRVLPSQSASTSNAASSQIIAQNAFPENHHRQEMLLVVAPGFIIIDNNDDEEDKKDEEDEEESTQGLYISSSTSGSSASSSLLPHNVHKARARQRSHSSVTNDIDAPTSSDNLPPAAKFLPFGWLCSLNSDSLQVWIEESDIEEDAINSFFNFIPIETSKVAFVGVSAQRLVLPEEASVIITETRFSTQYTAKDDKSLSGVAVLLEFVDAHGLIDSTSEDAYVDEKIDGQPAATWSPSFLSSLSADIRAVVAAGGVPLISLPNASEKAASIAASFALSLEPTSRVLSVSSARSLRSSLLDLRVWGASLAVGSRVDAMLPLTGAWAKATVVQHAPAPFQSWLRVDFDNLGPEWRRWVPWEFSSSRIVWGKAEIAPLGWITGSVELSTTLDKPLSDYSQVEHFIQSQNKADRQLPQVDTTNPTTLNDSQLVTFSGLDNVLPPKDSMERDLRSSCCLALAACVESPLKDAVRSDRETLSRFALIALSSSALKYALDSWRATISVGCLLDACDTHGKFYEAKIVESTPTDVKVRFLGWSPSSHPEKFDERIPRVGTRLLPKNCKIRDWRRIQVGDEIEARDDRTVIDHTVVDVNAAKGLIRTVSSTSPVTVTGGSESSFELNPFASNQSLPTALVTNWHSIHDIFRFACFGTHRRPRQWSEVDREQEGLKPYMLREKAENSTLYDSTITPRPVVTLAASFDSSVGHHHHHHQMLMSTTCRVASCISNSLKWVQEIRKEHERLQKESNVGATTSSANLSAPPSALSPFHDQSYKNKKAALVTSYLESALQVCGHKNELPPFLEVEELKRPVPLDSSPDIINRKKDENETEEEFIEFGGAMMEGLVNVSQGVTSTSVSSSSSSSSSSTSSLTMPPIETSEALQSQTASIGFESSSSTHISLPDLIQPLPDTLFLRPAEVPSSFVKLPSLSASLTLSAWLRLPPPLHYSSNESNVSGVLLYQAAMMDLPDPVLPGTLVEARFAVYRWYPACVERVNADGTYEVAYEDGDRSSSLTRDRLRPRAGARQALSVSVLSSGALQASVSVYCEPAEPADTSATDKAENVESSAGTSPAQPPLHSDPYILPNPLHLPRETPLVVNGNDVNDDSYDRIAAYVRYRQLQQAQAITTQTSSSTSTTSSNAATTTATTTAADGYLSGHASRMRNASSSRQDLPPRQNVPIMSVPQWVVGDPSTVVPPQPSLSRSLSPRRMQQDQRQYRVAFSVTSSSTLMDTQWTHVAVSASNGILAIYVNGVCEARMAAELFPRSSSVFIGGACRLPIDPIDLQKCASGEGATASGNTTAEAYRIVDPVPVDTPLSSEWTSAFGNSAVRSLFAPAPRMLVHDLSIQDAWATPVEIKRLMEAGGRGDSNVSQPRRKVLQATCVSRMTIYSSIIEKAIALRSPRLSIDRSKASERSPSASNSASTSSPSTSVTIRSSTYAQPTMIDASDRSGLRVRRRRIFLPAMSGGPDVNADNSAPTSISEEQLDEQLLRVHNGADSQLGELGPSSVDANPGQSIPSTPPTHPPLQHVSAGEAPSSTNFPQTDAPQSVANANRTEAMNRVVQSDSSGSRSHADAIIRLINDAKIEISAQMQSRFRDGQRQIAVSRVLKVAIGPHASPSFFDSRGLSYLSTPLPTLSTTQNDESFDEEEEEEKEDDNEEEEEEEEEEDNEDILPKISPSPSSASRTSMPVKEKETQSSLSPSSFLKSAASAVQGVVSQAEAFNVLLERPGLLVWCDLYDKRLPCVLGPPTTPMTRFERGSSRKFTVTLLPWPSAGSLGGTTASVEISNMLVLRPQPSAAAVAISSPPTPVFSSSSMSLLRGTLSAHASPLFRGGGGGGGGGADSSLEHHLFIPPLPPPLLSLTPRSPVSVDGFVTNSVRTGIIDSAEVTASAGVSPMLSSRSPLRRAAASAAAAVAAANSPFIISVSNPSSSQNHHDVLSTPRRGHPHSSNSSLHSTPRSTGRDASHRIATGSPTGGRNAVTLTPRGLEQWASNQTWQQQNVDALGVLLQQRDASMQSPPYTMRFVTLQQFAGEIASLASHIALQQQQQRKEELQQKRMKKKHNNDTRSLDADNGQVVGSVNPEQVNEQMTEEVKKRANIAEIDSILSDALVNSCRGVSRVLRREAENGSITLQAKSEDENKEHESKLSHLSSSILVSKKTLSRFIWSLATENSECAVSISRSLALSLHTSSPDSFIKSLLLSSLGKISFFLGCCDARSRLSDPNTRVIEAARLAESAFFVVTVVSRYLHQSSHLLSTFEREYPDLLLSLLISVLTAIVNDGQSISTTSTSAAVAIVNVPSESDLLMSTDPIHALECALSILRLILPRKNILDQAHSLPPSTVFTLRERVEDLKTIASMCSEATNRENISKAALDASVSILSPLPLSTSSSLSFPSSSSSSSSLPQAPVFSTISSSRAPARCEQIPPLDMTILMYEAASGRLLPDVALAAGATTAASAAAYTAQVAANALSMRPFVVFPRNSGPPDAISRQGGRAISRDIIAESIRSGIATSDFLPSPTVTRMFSPRLCRLAVATVFEIETRLLTMPVSTPSHREDASIIGLTSSRPRNINNSTSSSTECLLTLESCLNDLDLEKLRHLNWTRFVDVAIIESLDDMERNFVGEQWRLSRSPPSLVSRSMTMTTMDDLTTSPSANNRDMMSQFEFAAGRQAETPSLLEGGRPRSPRAVLRRADDHRTTTLSGSSRISQRGIDIIQSIVDVTRDAARVAAGSLPIESTTTSNSDALPPQPQASNISDSLRILNTGDELRAHLRWLDLELVVNAVNKERDSGSQLTREHISARVVLILRLVAATIASLQSLSFSSNGDGDDDYVDDSCDGVSSRLGQRLLRTSHLLPFSAKQAIFRAALSLSKTQVNTARAVAAASSAASAAISASSTSLDGRSDDPSQPGGMAIDRARALAAAPQGSVEAALLRSLSTADGGGEGPISWGLQANNLNQVQASHHEHGSSSPLTARVLPTQSPSSSSPSPSLSLLSSHRLFYSSPLWKALRRELNVQWPALLLVSDGVVPAQAFEVLFSQPTAPAAAAAATTKTKSVDTIVRRIEIQPMSSAQSSALDARGTGHSQSQSSGTEVEGRQSYGAERSEREGWGRPFPVRSSQSPWRHYDPVSDESLSQSNLQQQQQQLGQQQQQQQRPHSIRLTDVAQRELARMLEHDVSSSVLISANADAPTAFAGSPAADADAEADDDENDDDDDDDDNGDDNNADDAENEEDEEVVTEARILDDMMDRVNNGDIEAMMTVVNSMTASDFEAAAAAMRVDPNSTANSAAAMQWALQLSVVNASTIDLLADERAGTGTGSQSQDFLASESNLRPLSSDRRHLPPPQQTPTETPHRWLLPTQAPSSSSPPSSSHVVLLPPTPSTHLAFLDGSVIRISISRWLTETATSVNSKGVRARIFPQLLHSLEGSLPRGALRQSSRPWRIEFLGEGGTDAGGLFAEALTAAIEDVLPSNVGSPSLSECVSVPRIGPLHIFSVHPLIESTLSTKLPLFVPTPNAKRGDGSRQDCAYQNPLLLDPLKQWPGVRRSTALRLAFVGRLIGVSLRLSIVIPLVLPPVMWSLIQHVAGTVHEDDQTPRKQITGTTPCRFSAMSSRVGGGVHTDEPLSSSANQLMTTFLSPTERVVTRALQFLNRQCPHWLSSFDHLLHTRECDQQIESRQLRTSQECRNLVRALLPSASCLAFGLDSAIPLLPLRLFSTDQFEKLVTGTAGIDVDLLQSRTTYEGWLLPMSRSEMDISSSRNISPPSPLPPLIEIGINSSGGGVIPRINNAAESPPVRVTINDTSGGVTTSSHSSPFQSSNSTASSNSSTASSSVIRVTRQEEHPSVVAFWRALREMSPSEQESVMMFIYARRRLPPANIPWPSNFTLMRMGRDAPDQSLPCGHTCSFQLDLPAYSSYQVCKRQLLMAATSCIGYDLDGGSNGPGGAGGGGPQ